MLLALTFFMSLFWWKRFPQNWHGYGRVSEWIKRCVERVLDRLKALPHCLHSKTFSTLWTALNENVSSLVIHINHNELPTCVDLSWFHDRTFCCRARRRMGAFHCETFERAPPSRAVCWTFSRTWYTSTHRRLVPWCPAAWIDDDVDNGDGRSLNVHLSVDSNCYSAASSDEILKCPRATVDGS